MQMPGLSESVWRKSSRSNSNGGQCVEVATNLPNVSVRDSKDRFGPILSFSRVAWTAFINGTRA
jgi:hypothetical protein